MPMELFHDREVRAFLADLYRDISVGLKEYFRNAATAISVFILLYTVLCFIIYRQFCYKKKKNVIFQNSRRVLLVTAHPDDECMFFGPTLVNIIREGVDVYLLCLSNGDYYKQGRTRRSELYDACQVLDIKEHCIFLCIDQSMPDDSKVRWPSDHVASIILHYIEALSIDVLITFDKNGVSQHVNHSSIYYAVARLCIEKRFPKGCKFLTLDSVNVLRKYWGYLDLLVSFIFSSHWFTLSWRESKTVVRAMKEHKSQMAWFRYLYLFFSRYVVVNTLRDISMTDLELDLLLDD